MPIQRGGKWRAPLLAGVLLAALAGWLILGPPAFAISAPIHIANTGGQGVFIRPQPNTSQPAVGWMAEGTSPDYHCWTQGQNINGVDVWFYVTSPAGVTGYYASYYDDSSYAHDSDITLKYGIPQCGTASPPPNPASITASIGGQYGCGSCNALNIAVHNFPTGTYTYSCHDNSGPGGSDTAFYSHAVAVTDPNQSSWPGVFCYDSAPYTAYLVMDGVTSNSVTFGSSAPPISGGGSGGSSGGGGGGSGSGVGSGGGAGSDSGGAGGKSSSSLVFTIGGTGGGVYYRNSPHWADTPQIPGVGVYDGDRVQLICGGSGDRVGPSSNTAWSYVTNLSRSVGSGWVSEHFIADGAAPNSWPSGEPQCGATTPGSPAGSTSPTRTGPGPTSVFYSPDNDPSTNLGIGPIADLNIPSAEWALGGCRADGAANVPSAVSTLAGWSVGRLGPIYFLDAATQSQKAALHNIVLFDPGNTQDFHPTGLHKLRYGDSCDWHLPINSLLANWLKMSSANRLTIFTGADTEEMSGTDPTYHGLWQYYLGGIWNQPFAWQAQICDYESRAGGMSHPDVLRNFHNFVQHPHDGCEAAPSGYSLTAWNP